MTDIHPDDLLAAYQRQAHTPGTGQAYTAAARDALAFLAVTQLSEITLDGLGRYREHLLELVGGGIIAPNTMQVRLAGVRSFLNFARLRGHVSLARSDIGAVLAVSKGRPMRSNPILTIDEQQCLLRYLAARTATVAEQRDYALVYLLLWSGLKADEIPVIRVRDVRLSGRILLQDPDRVLTPPPQMSDVLADWVTLSRPLPPDPESFVFYGRRLYSRCSVAMVRHIVRQTTLGAFGMSLTPLSLRLSALVRKLREGEQVAMIARDLCYSLFTVREYAAAIAKQSLKEGIRGTE